MKTSDSNSRVSEALIDYQIRLIAIFFFQLKAPLTAFHESKCFCLGFCAEYFNRRSRVNTYFVSDFRPFYLF